MHSPGGGYLKTKQFLGMETLKIRSKQLYNDCNSPPQARKNG